MLQLASAFESTVISKLILRLRAKRDYKFTQHRLCSGELRSLRMWQERLKLPWSHPGSTKAAVNGISMLICKAVARGTGWQLGLLSREAWLCLVDHVQLGNSPQGLEVLGEAGSDSQLWTELTFIPSVMCRDIMWSGFLIAPCMFLHTSYAVVL